MDMCTGQIFHGNGRISTIKINILTGFLLLVLIAEEKEMVLAGQKKLHSRSLELYSFVFHHALIKLI
jgi:hypothetical protein